MITTAVLTAQSSAPTNRVTDTRVVGGVKPAADPGVQELEAKFARGPKDIPWNRSQIAVS